MEFLANIHWASTEVIYFGSYALVIAVSLMTVLLTKRAAKVQDLEQAKAKLDESAEESDPGSVKSAPPTTSTKFSSKRVVRLPKHRRQEGFPSAA